ncbi:MAG: cysteine--tRNA ligase, partial [Chitinophagaceae bacterium]|nr:cysteine--tRNA ligase [Chitinophagaceae bacterium]
NTLTREKEVFKPINAPHVGMYVCGPTLYSHAHLGNCRTFLSFDVVFRYLKHLGYKVRYVRNITDAGHFEEEGRAATDKIAEKSQLEKLEPMELVQKYTNLYHWAMNEFNCLPPSIEPTATGHIVEQIEMIKKIIDAGLAYEKNGSVYFDVKKYAASNDYGKLSGRILEDLLETTRDLEGQDEKNNKVDFALWKNAAPEHIMRWPSPWGEGFPGWHIECSAMACKYLGTTFDIHGGGMDLQFPHHESEIAQSTVANGQAPVRYWMHNNMITIDGRKMGKSYNNVIKLSELFAGTHPILEQAYSPMAVRFSILQSHYRSPLDFSNEALQAAQKGYERLMEAYVITTDLRSAWEVLPDTAGTDTALVEKVQSLCASCADYMNDDFSTPKVLANLFELAPVVNSLKHQQVATASLGKETLLLLANTFETYLITIMGLLPPKIEEADTLNGVLGVLIELRKEAKMKKDFATSDAIRDKLLSVGIQLKDEKGGEMSWSKL